MTELSNLCGLAQVRAVKKSCHAGLVFSHTSEIPKIAPVFVGSEGSKLSPQVINIPCPNRACDGAQNTAEALALQAVRFIDKNVAGLALGIEDEFLNANSFSELLREYTSGVIAPYMMRGLLPVSAIRVSLDVIVLSSKGLTREALLSEAGFEKLFRTENWVRRSKLFCR